MGRRAYRIGGLFCFLTNPAPIPFLMVTFAPPVHGHAFPNTSGASAARLASRPFSILGLGSHPDLHDGRRRLSGL